MRRPKRRLRRLANPPSVRAPARGPFFILRTTWRAKCVQRCMWHFARLCDFLAIVWGAAICFANTPRKFRTRLCLRHTARIWGRVPDVPQARMGMCCKCVCDLWRTEKEGARVLASANSAPDARRIACDSRAEKSGQMARMMLLIPGVIDSSRENAHHF